MRDGNQHGPVPTTKLKDLAASGQLQPTDMVWRDGMAEWVPASAMKGLWASGVAPAPRAAAPVLREREEDADDRPRRSRRGGRDFEFDGGAGSFFVTGLLAYLVMLFTLGLGYPWALCMYQRWAVEHTLVQGRRLHFTGTGGDLIGLWIKWFFLSLITFSIYMFWIIPSLNRWIAEHTEFERD